MSPVHLHAYLPLECEPLFRELLSWLNAYQVQVFDGTYWHARLPSRFEAPLQVNWLWEKMRARVSNFLLYASWGITASTFPFAPFTFNFYTETGIFGTGKHPTTQMCLIALQHLPLQGKRVIDIGTGSGILAFAALSQGAKVVATEISFRIAKRARENLSTQSNPLWAVVVCDLAASLKSTFDVVVCNISSEALMRLLPDLDRILPCGKLVASGWMANEWRSVRRLLRFHGFKLASWQFFSGWMGIVAER